MNIFFLVCYHKKDIFKEAGTFPHIHAGEVISDIDLGLISDDEDTSISQKDTDYWELTGIYWTRKNLKDIDCIKAETKTKRHHIFKISDELKNDRISTIKNLSKSDLHDINAKLLRKNI